MHQLRAEHIPLEFEDASKAEVADRLLHSVYQVLDALAEAINDLSKLQMKKGMGKLAWLKERWEEKLDGVTRTDSVVVQFFFEKCGAINVPVVPGSCVPEDDPTFDLTARDSELAPGLRSINRAIQDALQAALNS
jgi:hypothetical protein